MWGLYEFLKSTHLFLNYKSNTWVLFIVERWHFPCLWTLCLKFGSNSTPCVIPLNMFPHSSESLKAALLPLAKRNERKGRPPSQNIWSGYSPGLYIHIKIPRVVLAAAVTENNSANRIIFCEFMRSGTVQKRWNLSYRYPLSQSPHVTSW